MHNRWGIAYVIESLAFERHLRMLIKLREKMERDGVSEEYIKKVLTDKCWFAHQTQLEVIDGEKRRGYLPNWGEELYGDREPQRAVVGDMSQD